MSKTVIPKWATAPDIPNKPGVSDALTAYNAEMGEALATGDPNPIWDFLMQAVLHGHFITSRSRDPLQLVEMEVNEDTLRFFASVAGMRRIVAMGGDLYSYPIFLQFPAAALASNVPLSFPNSTYVPDPENAPEVNERYTVAEYFDNEIYPQTFDGGVNYVVPNQAMRGDNSYLPASLWINLPGVSFMTVDQYQDLNTGS